MFSCHPLDVEHTSAIILRPVQHSESFSLSQMALDNGSTLPMARNNKCRPHNCPKHVFFCWLVLEIKAIHNALGLFRVKTTQPDVNQDVSANAKNIFENGSHAFLSCLGRFVSSNCHSLEWSQPSWKLPHSCAHVSPNATRPCWCPPPPDLHFS